MRGEKNRDQWLGRENQGEDIGLAEVVILRLVVFSVDKVLKMVVVSN